MGAARWRFRENLRGLLVWALGNLWLNYDRHRSSLARGARFPQGAVQYLRLNPDQLRVVMRTPGTEHRDIYGVTLAVGEKLPLFAAPPERTEANTLMGCCEGSNVPEWFKGDTS